MNYSGNEWFWRHVVGEARSRTILLTTVISLLVLSSGGFVIGLDTGLSLGWIVLAFGLALVAGVMDTGLGPTVGSLWLISLCWFLSCPSISFCLVWFVQAIPHPTVNSSLGIITFNNDSHDIQKFHPYRQRILFREYKDTLVRRPQFIPGKLSLKVKQ